jgi:transcriptional regulator with XRE-family HTH domain
LDLREVQTALGNRVRELREERGLTQAQAAERCEMQLAAFQQLEYGERNATLKTLVRVATTFDVPIREFFAPPTSKRASPGRPRRG